ncbi:hypothetical protein A6M21_06710 [Desulfotomaculum copahuensis]|uniref:O-succinylbenzoate--CoA ligase n=1 Tax=Desulfotomaculum copahuensis TaxID=1838280 RepID=A0A1B7LGV1_9FIRM|nr:hypothetical protein A6M21_06710 [Desulfotomaculum copahuensis]
MLTALLERNARKYPADPGVKWPEKGVTLTWAELNRRAGTLAGYLKQHGIKRGDKVAVFISNRPEFVVAFFGILKAGAVVVPVNVKLTPVEAAYILDNSESSALLYEDELRTQAEQAAAACPAVKTTCSTAEFPGLYNRFDMNGHPAAVPGDVAEIIYTSGTTGRPKGVVLSHAAVYLTGSMMAYEGEIRFGDRVLQLMPLTHSAPLNLFLTGAVFAGASRVLGSFSPAALVELAAQEKTTHFFGAPVAYLLASRLPNLDRYDLSAAKRWIYGGASMSREAVLQVSRHFPGGLMGVYGLTEAGPNGMALYPAEHPEFAGSIGRRATVNAELRVVDEQGRDVPAGEPGEIIIRTAGGMTGYYRNGQATRETLKDGWIYTGDMARKDEAGYLWIIDRKKDMIISGGVNVYPREVEDVLTACPVVADAAVTGVPHPEWGETVVALVVPRDAANPPSAEEILAYCRQRLAGYKVPRLIRFAGVIPRNASGKVLKNEIREQFGR